jgi:hypothetical protein
MKVKDWPFTEGSRDYHVLELFIFKTEVKLFWEVVVPVNEWQ